MKVSALIAEGVMVAVVLMASGCASTDVQKIGPNTYEVICGGWPTMSGAKDELDCYEAENRFCSSHHLEIVTNEPTVIEGKDFQNNASCKLVFIATNSIAK